MLAAPRLADMAAPAVALPAARPPAHPFCRGSQLRRCSRAASRCAARAGPMRRQEAEEAQRRMRPAAPLHKRVLTGAAAAALAAALVASPVGKAWAADTAKVGQGAYSNFSIAAFPCSIDSL